MLQIPKILLVDDDKLMHKLFAQILSKNEYHVDAAYSADEAMKKLKKNEYDAAIFDICLGDKDGTEILKLVKNGKNLVKIMITATPNVDNAITSLNLGADAYFKKPFNANEFCSTLKLKLKEKSKSQEFSDDKINFWLEQKLNSVYKEV